MENRRTVCLFLSYVGSYFRGSQFQPPPIRTVQRSIQEALGSLLKNGKELPLRFASRTDSGVHAYVNVASFPLVTKRRLNQTTVVKLHYQLNSALEKNCEPLKVTDIKIVAADDFDCRRSISEKRYVYRLGLLPSDVLTTSYVNKMDALEAGLVGLVSKPKQGFNMEDFYLAGEMLSGTNDYSLFRVQPTDLYDTCFQRVVRSCSISIEPGSPPPLAIYKRDNLVDIEYWNITFSGKGFMHKQIRYMVGAMIAVGAGRITLSQLEELLMHPEFGRKTSGTYIAVSNGLYLTNLDYPQHCFAAE